MVNEGCGPSVEEDACLGKCGFPFLRLEAGEAGIVSQSNVMVIADMAFLATPPSEPPSAVQHCR